MDVYFSTLVLPILGASTETGLANAKHSIPHCAFPLEIFPKYRYVASYTPLMCCQYEMHYSKEEHVDHMPLFHSNWYSIIMLQIMSNLLHYITPRSHTVSAISFLILHVYNPHRNWVYCPLLTHDPNSEYFTPLMCCQDYRKWLGH